MINAERSRGDNLIALVQILVNISLKWKGFLLAFHDMAAILGFDLVSFESY